MRTIIYYGNVLFPDLDAASHRVIGNAKALRELGYRVVLVGTRKGEIYPITSTHEVFLGFDIYYFPDPNSSAQWGGYIFSFKPLKQIFEIEKDVCAVMLYNHPSISSKRIHTYCSKRGIKVYADCTEWFAPQGFSFHSIIKKWDTWYRMRRVNCHLDGVMAISSYLELFYKERGCKTMCVPPLIDKSDPKWDYSDNAKSNDIVTLCYVGNPGAGAKDKLDRIVYALDRVLQSKPSIKIVLQIVGMTKEQYEEAFGNEKPENGFVHFWGRLSNKEALSIIKASDYSIFIRDTNLVCTAGFPTKFVESIACGTPVLTNHTSDIGKYLNNGINGYGLDVSSDEKLVESLVQALSVNREKIEEMKQACREDSTFDYKSFLPEFSKLF